MFADVIVGGICLIVGYVLFTWVQRKLLPPSHPLLVRAKGYPLIGCMFSFLPNRIMQTAKDWPRIYGNFVEFYIFSTRAVFITDAAIAKEVFGKRPKKFSRLRNLGIPQKVLGTDKGLFQTNGEEWNHLPTTGTKVVDMKYQAFSLTIRVISIIAFGLDSDNPICKHFFSELFLRDIEAIFRYSVDRALFFFPEFVWRYSSHYAIEQRAVEGNQRFNTACQEMIDYKRRCQAENPHSYNITSMIDSMLTKESQGSSLLADDEIIPNVKTIYMAGTDTTSVVISWICVFFADHPEYLLRAREEASRILFQDNGRVGRTRKECIEAMSHVEIVNRLSFCHACVKEVLRLVGPVSTNSAQTADPTESVALSNGLVIGPNDIAWVNVDGIHYNPEIFPNPLTFNPDRWLTTDSEQLRQLESHFFAFGYGPRICPGMYLANVEAEVAVAFLAYHFDMELACPREEVYRIRSFTAQANKVPLIMTLKNPILQ